MAKVTNLAANMEHQTQNRCYFYQNLRRLLPGVHSSPAIHHVSEENRLSLWTDKVPATTASHHLVFESTASPTLSSRSLPLLHGERC